MEKQYALQQLEQLQKKLYAIHYACSAMNLDADTVAPKKHLRGPGCGAGCAGRRGAAAHDLPRDPSPAG